MKVIVAGRCVFLLMLLLLLIAFADFCMCRELFTPEIILAVVEEKLLADLNGADGNKPNQMLARVHLDLEVTRACWGVVDVATPTGPADARSAKMLSQKSEAADNPLVRTLRAHQAVGAVVACKASVMPTC